MRQNVPLGKIRSTLTGAVFVLAAQAVDLLRENPHRYGENASGRFLYAYSPYGETQTVGPDSTGNPIDYMGRENDSTGLKYFRARYYDPILKRFISADPIGLDGGLNEYMFVEGAPTMYTDPTGLLFMSTVGGVQRNTTLDQAATYGAPGNAAAAAGMATAAAGAAGYGAGARVVTPLLRDIITGREYKFGDDFRAAPWGNRTGNEYGRWPHYHRRGTDGQGNTIPGQGIGRHRPWETKSPDRNMCDRF